MIATTTIPYTQLVPLISSAQAILRAHYGSKPIGPPNRKPSVIRIDGRWGTYTQFAYDNAPATVQLEIRNLLAKAGTNLDVLRASAAATFSPDRGREPAANVTLADSSMKRYFDYPTLASYVRGALIELGAVDRMVAVKFTPAQAASVIEVIAGREILDLEAARDKRGMYDAFSANPTSSARGWAQFLTGTWNDMVAQLRKRSGVTAPLNLVAPATRNVAAPGLPFDAVASAYVYAEYTLRNALALKRAGMPVSTATLYTLHQQGTAGGIGFLKGRKPLDNASGQSAASLNVIAQAAQEVRRA